MKREDMKRKMIALKQLDVQLYELAFLWLVQRIEAHGNTIENKECLKKELFEWVKLSWMNNETSAVICNCETLFNKKRGKMSLRKIFDNHGIKLGDYIFSITIFKKHIVVVDGFSGVRKVLLYDPEKNSFSYKSVNGYYNTI